jgi:nitric oxide reductase activation protein
MNQAKAKFLGNVQDAGEYQKRMNTFNQINDSRIFQESTPEEVRKLKASMSPDEQRRMGEKIKLAKSLGLL